MDNTMSGPSSISPNAETSLSGPILLPGLARPLQETGPLPKRQPAGPGRGSDLIDRFLQRMRARARGNEDMRIQNFIAGR